MNLGDIILGPVFSLIEKYLPDPAAKAAAQLELIKVQQSSEFKAIDAELEAARNQTEINKVEAANPNLFVSGWRSAVGWIFAMALFAQYIGQPLLTWLSTAKGWPVPPKLDLGDLIVLGGGMLGLGGLRSVEKIKGVA